MMDAEVVKRRDANGIRLRRAKVCFSYEPQHEDELALKVGDEVEVHGEDEEGWYQATVNGRTGVCPSNFVELLPDEKLSPLPDLTLPEMAKSPSADSTKDSANKELKEKLNNTLSRNKDADNLKRQSLHDPLASTNPPTPTSENRPPTEDSKGEKSAKKVQGVGFGDIFAGGQVKLKSAAKSNGEEKIIGPAEGKRPANTLVSTLEKDKDKGKTDSKKEKENDKDRADEKLEYAKAEYDYEAASGDELSFKTGDIIRIISKECEDEGWWRGELNGLTGVFPDNFCIVIPLAEVPAPKRPARPSATDKTTTPTKKETTKPNEKDTAKEIKAEEKHHALPADKHTPEKTAKPDKPTAKPVVGKKPTSGTGAVSKSREGSVDLGDSTEKTKEKDAKESGGKKHENGKHEADRVNHKVKHEEEVGERSGSSGVTMRHNGHTGSVHAAPSTPESTRSEKGVGFDSVHSGQKLNHMTRAKGPQRRPPSMILVRPNSEENGVDAGEELVSSVLKDKEKDHDGVKSSSDTPVQDKTASGLAKKDSFLKHLDTTLGARPKSPGSTSRPVIDYVPVPPPPHSLVLGGSLEDEVKHLREEVRLLKEDFAAQLKDLRELLKQQADRTSTLEKEVERSRSSSHGSNSTSPRP